MQITITYNVPCPECEQETIGSLALAPIRLECNCSCGLSFSLPEESLAEELRAVRRSLRQQSDRASRDLLSVLYHMA